MLRSVLVVVVVVSATLLPGPVQAASQGQPEPTSTTEGPVIPSPDIIPEPGSGEAPTEAGDRGGALQLGLLAILVVGLGGGSYALYRQSKRARVDPQRPRSR